jgi:hypothetical protein
MSNYTYTKNVSDFLNELSNKISNEQLKYDISCSINIPIIYVNRIGNTFQFNFNAELTETDITSFNTLIANYKTRNFNNDVAILKCSKSVGTNAGTFIENTWIKRGLNKIEGIVDYVYLNENGQFILQPGIYDVTVICPAVGVYNHRCRIYDSTNNIVIGNGTNAFSVGYNQTHSYIYQYLDIGIETKYEIQHMCSKTNEDIGLGFATGFGGDEVYSIVKIKVIKLY